MIFDPPPPALIALAVGLVAVLGLSRLLWAVGREAGAGLIPVPAARAARLGVVGAFASIGLGVVALIGAVAAEMRLGALPANLAQIGATLCLLGISFAVAASTLRGSLRRVDREAREARETRQTRQTRKRERENAAEPSPTPTAGVARIEKWLS